MPARLDPGAATAPAFGGKPAPLVTAAERAEDQQFFFEHPARRYRIGSRWVVRRCGADVFLRAPIPAGSHADDTEEAAEQAWWLAAWPDLDPKTRSRMAASARRRGRR